MVSIHRHQWRVGLVIVFVVAAFQTHSIHSTYMREDEEIAYRSTQYDLGYAVRFQAERDVQAPLWFASFWLWQQFMGSSEFMGRVYSIFLSMMTVVMVYQIGRRWFGAARYGLFAMVALGVNSFFFIYSLEIRPYALVMLSATISMLFFWRWLNQRTWRAAILYGLTLALMLYIHYFLGFLIVAQGIYFFMELVRFRRQTLKRPAAKKPSPLKGLDNASVHPGTTTQKWTTPLGLLWQGGVASLVAVVVWLPWLPMFVGQIVKLQRLEADVTRGVGISSTTEPTTLEAIVRLINVATNGLPGLYVLCLIAGLIFLWRKHTYWLALLWGGGAPMIALLINLAASVYTQRYVTYLSVGLALAVGVGLGAIFKTPPSNPLPIHGEGEKDIFMPRQSRMSLGVVALVGFVALNLWGMPSQLPIHTPYRDLLRGMSAAAHPGDVVFLDHANTNDNYVQWQFQHYLSPELRENTYNRLEPVLDARRIWHVTAEWFDEEVRSNFTEIERTHPRQMGFGSCNREWCYLIQLMEAPPWQEATVFGEDMAFWGADVDSVTQAAISTRLWWRVEQAPERDYSMSLQVLDESGALIAQFDGPINHYGEAIIQTSRWEPGQIYIDHRSILLPPDLAPGEYRLALVVYQPWDGARLTLVDGSDTLILDTIVIP